MIQLGRVLLSIDINVSYLRSVTKDSGVLRATGRVIKPGRRVPFLVVIGHGLLAAATVLLVLLATLGTAGS
jgi:acyl-coenzyme A thioesterase PaaI-like protein